MQFLYAIFTFKFSGRLIVLLCNRGLLSII